VTRDEVTRDEVARYARAMPPRCPLCGSVFRWHRCAALPWFGDDDVCPRSEQHRCQAPA